MQKQVVIDCFSESQVNYQGNDVIVAVDVIRATTTAMTGASLGRRCFLVPSVEEAEFLATQLNSPLLVGEINGFVPTGFDMNNSPAELEVRTDINRPMILLSTSGTKLVCSVQGTQAVYVACLRNYSAQAAHLATHYSKVALIGAGSKGDFRDEDQLCCAWIAEHLLKVGFEPHDTKTATIIERWRGISVDVIANSASAKYLKLSDQSRDLEFILTHLDDLREIYRFEHGQMVKLEV